MIDLGRWMEEEYRVSVPGELDEHSFEPDNPRHGGTAEMDRRDGGTGQSSV